MINFAVWYLTFGVGFAMFHNMTGQTKLDVDTQSKVNEPTVKHLLEDTEAGFDKFYRKLIKVMIYLQITILIIIFYPVFILMSVSK